MEFYHRVIIKGYFKDWLALADKKKKQGDVLSSYLLYSYAGYLGLSKGSY